MSKTVLPMQKAEVQSLVGEVDCTMFKILHTPTKTQYSQRNLKNIYIFEKTEILKYKNKTKWK